MNYINFNGRIIDAQQPVIQAGNRGFRYGDGLFETLKYSPQGIVLFQAHMERLLEGARALQFDIPSTFTLAFVEAEIMKLLKKNSHLRSTRIRLTLFRGQGGLYDAEHHRPDFLIESWPLSPTYDQYNENGLHLCIYDTCRKPMDVYSRFKHNNFLPYLLGALEAKKQRCNDALILNSEGYLCDSTIANVFLIKNGMLYTPGLDQGCVAGIMRAELIRLLPELGYSMVEKPLNVGELLEADEVFLTNSVFVLRWVGCCGDKTYGNKEFTTIYQQLRQTSPTLFC